MGFFNPTSSGGDSGVLPVTFLGDSGRTWQWLDMQTTYGAGAGELLLRNQFSLGNVLDIESGVGNYSAMAYSDAFGWEQMAFGFSAVAKTASITGWSDNGAGLYRITVVDATVWGNVGGGGVAKITGATGTGVNNTWAFVVVSTTQMDLLGSTFVAGATGGTIATQNIVPGYNYLESSGIFSPARSGTAANPIDIIQTGTFNGVLTNHHRIFIDGYPNSMVSNVGTAGDMYFWRVPASSVLTDITAMMRNTGEWGFGSTIEPSRASMTAAVNVTAPDSKELLQLFGYSVSGSAATRGMELTGVWNTSNNPEAVYVNMTKTATGGAASLLKLQLNGVNRLLVDESGDITVAGFVFGNNLRTSNAAGLVSSTVTMNNGAGANAGTLTNAPAIGNPTKWIPIIDNGTTRYVPAW